MKSSELMTQLEEPGLGYSHFRALTVSCHCSILYLLSMFTWLLSLDLSRTSDYSLRECAGRGPFNCSYSITYGGTVGEDLSVYLINIHLLGQRVLTVSCQIVFINLSFNLQQFKSHISCPLLKILQQFLYWNGWTASFMGKRHLSCSFWVNKSKFSHFSLRNYSFFATRYF